jgi:hypothetical protein
VWVVPTDEEQIIGWHTRAMISAPHGHAERS